MTGFDGRSFEIIGQAGTIYSLISEKHHKVFAIPSADQALISRSKFILTLQSAVMSERKKPVPNLSSYCGPMIDIKLSSGLR